MSIEPQGLAHRPKPAKNPASRRLTRVRPTRAMDTNPTPMWPPSTARSRAPGLDADPAAAQDDRVEWAPPAGSCGPGGRWLAWALAGLCLGLGACTGPGLEPPGERSGGPGLTPDVPAGGAAGAGGAGGTAGTLGTTGGAGGSGGVGGAGSLNDAGAMEDDAGVELDEDAGLVQ